MNKNQNLKSTFHIFGRTFSYHKKKKEKRKKEKG